MPPFGTNGVLTRHEVLQIVAYLHTLNHPIAAPARPQPQSRNYDVAGEDFTPADRYIEEGEVLFRQAADNGKSCASCHAGAGHKAPDLKGAAATYPKYHPGQQQVIGLEQRINICRKRYQGTTPYHLGSAPSNRLTSYLKYLSRDIPLQVAVDGPAAEALARGKASFYRKAGRLNFSCADCHSSSAGKFLRGQELSDMNPGGKYSTTAATWPRHFIALHDLGLISLRQRARHCQIVTQTYPLPLHSQEYTELELYLTSLANGAPMQAPTMSRLRGE
jgi:sulfur-oxidizing protein SoxA